jgi:hypothetical protein
MRADRCRRDKREGCRCREFRLRATDLELADDRRQGKREFEYRKVVAYARPRPGSAR